MKATSEHYQTRNGNENGAVYDFRPEEPAEREALILKYAPLIKYIAHRLAMRLPAHISVEDLISAGAIGLMDAVNKFDPGKRVQFSTYAEYRIKGAMLDELRALDWVPRSVRQKMSRLDKAYTRLQKEKGRPVEEEEVAAELGLDLEGFYGLLNDTTGVAFLDIDHVPRKLTGLNEEDLLQLLMDDESRDPAFQLGFMELKTALAQTIDKLTQKEKTIIALYYYDELTLKEIGQVMGFTESRICQIHSKVILKLRTQLKKIFEAG
ncbi:MAG: FliA/WhiG family RNA polymerase sigma factor [Deltaproteobacteria bacterium]|nr:FliA/WhiG family RNA polymerase sigma factor [Deltaproteobacteria bacterium]